MCNDEMKMLIGVIVNILNFIKFFVPIILIVFCTIDIFKIIVSKKEDEIKKLRKDVFMKIVYCIVIYLIPYLVPFILKTVNKLVPMDYNDDWKKCFDYVQNQEKIKNNN